MAATVADTSPWREPAGEGAEIDEGPKVMNVVDVYPNQACFIGQKVGAAFRDRDRVSASRRAWPWKSLEWPPTVEEQ